MGNNHDAPSNGKTTKKQSQKINKSLGKKLKKHQKAEKQVNKILFLGSGGSGKSTLFKQLECIYGKGFDDKQRKGFIPHIHAQVITQMMKAIHMLDLYKNGNLNDILHQNEKNYMDTSEIKEEKEIDYGIVELSAKGKQSAQIISASSSLKLNNEIITALKCLWAETSVQQMYELRNITKIDESSAHFWDKLDELRDANYIPSDTDILKVRHRTTGVIEKTYAAQKGDMKGSFTVIDVGGQKSERKRWMPVFEGVTAVLFVASLTCYDEVLYEDVYSNSMTDQLQLFGKTCNDKKFLRTTTILFLNKRDLFEKKIKRVPLTKCKSFKSYDGPKYAFEESIRYIETKFAQQIDAENKKQVYVHVTCATDRNNVQTVFVDIQNSLVMGSLARGGLAKDVTGVYIAEVKAAEVNTSKQIATFPTMARSRRRNAVHSPRNTPAAANAHSNKKVRDKPHKLIPKTNKFAARKGNREFAMKNMISELMQANSDLKLRNDALKQANEALKHSKDKLKYSNNELKQENLKLTLKNAEIIKRTPNLLPMEMIPSVSYSLDSREQSRRHSIRRSRKSLSGFDFRLSIKSQKTAFIRTSSDQNITGNLTEKMKYIQKLNGANCALAMYYNKHGRYDYFDENGKGKFIKFRESYGVIPINMDKLDQDFPLAKKYDDLLTQNNAIFKIVLHCLNHGVPPKEEAEEDTLNIECKSVNECEKTKDIMNALKYFASVGNFQSEKNQNALVKYCKETYPQILDDYIHVLTAHNTYKDLDTIFKSLLAEYEFIECNIENCKLASRYYRDRSRNKSNEELVEFMFYRDIMDQIHFHLFHMFDTGMRININEMKDEHNPFEEDYKDSQFERMRSVVKTKMKTIPAINATALKSNKFTLNIIEQKNDNKDTFMDGFFNLIGSKHNIKRRAEMLNMLLKEEYDSDALNEDIIHTQSINSNVGIMHNNDKIQRMLQRFFYDVKLFSFTFNIGYRFYYWDHYKHQNLEEENEFWNINDHNGCKISELFIESKYENLKTEILDNKIHCLHHFQYKLSMNKVYKYINTKKAKTTQAFADEFMDRNQYLSYNIKQGEPISKEHLLSVVLYCDWSVLSTHFSKTFRKISSYEAVSLIKERNAEYANWSRLLRETVEMFGKSPQSTFNKLKGPFYSGMRQTMVIPEFNIRLCGPTSTSTSIEVATSFARDGGIVIQLNEPDDDLSAFQCSWVSNYASENEYLFCGGYERIRIESIRIMETSENFEPFFRALYLFDKMVDSNFFANESDVPIITNEEKVLLNSLIQHKLGAENKHSKYINSTFDAFINNKSQIVLNLYHIYEYFGKISDLIMQSSQTNLFKPILLDLFKNTKSIIIQSTEQIYENSFDLLSLLSVLSESSFMTSNSTITITAINQQSKKYWEFDVNHNEESWIVDAFDESIVSEYKAKKLNLQYEQRKNIGAVDGVDDCLKISLIPH